MKWYRKAAEGGDPTAHYNLGVEHCPIAETDTHFMLIEPASTEHTGKQKTDITIAVKEQEWI